MPATQTVDYRNEGYLQISIEPVDEPEDVYFTEHRPEFDLVFRNETDKEIRTREGDRWTGVRWILELEPGGEQILATGNLELCIAPSGEQRERIEPGLLAYEANAVLGVAGGAIRKETEDGDEYIEVEVSSTTDHISHILYTFTVWDESHYDAVHEQPKRLQGRVVRLQKTVVRLQKIVVLFAILTAFLQLTVIAMNAGVI